MKFSNAKINLSELETDLSPRTTAPLYQSLTAKSIWSAGKVLLCVVLLLGMNTAAFAQLNHHQNRFITHVLPNVRSVNHDIQLQRDQIEAIISKPTLSAMDTLKLRSFAKQYRLKHFTPQNKTSQRALLSRVDTVPVGLVLAQAITESGWGTSRFAKNGHNLFGQWCYKRGCGIVPHDRESRQYHEVKVFPSERASIKGYMHNLNSHPAYQSFRRLRASLSSSQHNSSVVLARGLQSYSSRGNAYIKQIQKIIARYRLKRYES